MSCDVAGHLPTGVGDEDELTRVAEARSRGSYVFTSESRNELEEAHGS